MAETQDNVWGEPDDQPTPEPVGVQDTDDTPSSEELLATARADLVNYRARVKRDLVAQYDAGRHEVFNKIIPVLDSIALAQEHGDLSDDNPLTPTFKLLARTLGDLGLGAIGEVGEPFDPEVHEAVDVEETSGADSATVSKVHQRGYATPEQLLRPARVTVSRPKPSA